MDETLYTIDKEMVGEVAWRAVRTVLRQPQGTHEQAALAAKDAVENLLNGWDITRPESD